MNSDFRFLKAVPVWEKGSAEKINQTLDFIVNIKKAPGSKLFVAGSTSFIVYVNGEFVGFGPARTAHGFYKVDRIELDEFLNREDNIVDIRVSGYNANSFCYLDQPSFLCAEILCGENVIAATGDNFKATNFESRIVKAPRYSYQRTFCEAYSLNENSYNAQNFGVGEWVCLEETEEKHFIERDVPYSEYKKLTPSKVFRTGKTEKSQTQVDYCPREIGGIGEKYKGFYESELEILPHKEYGQLKFTDINDVDLNAESIAVQKGGFADFDMGKNYTGLFDFTVDFKGDGMLLIAFNELLESGEINWRRGNLNVFIVKGKRGKYRFTSAEPYVMRYARLVAVDTDITVSDFGMREIAFPEKLIMTKLDTKDRNIAKIYDAALRSFRSNVLDIYMDCPSRERAGWLCDSFFIARTEMALTGKTEVEKSFLNNFLMPDSFEGLPEGMIPMCYPADVMNGEFIPNWAMWYGLQIYDYYTRTNDRELVDRAKNRLYGLLQYFKKFENEYGLLENLESWIFVEWSKANDLVQDVSFPTNMVYAALKSAIGTLYGDSELVKEGNQLRGVIKDMAMTQSGFFCDNAVRREGKLCLTGERTEVCQYYAFFFKVVTPEECERLWNTLVNDFGPQRANTQKHSEIYPANAFIGNYLRMELFSIYGEEEKLYNDIKDFFTYMAELTGTLWEHTNAGASCNHGFASYVIYWLKKIKVVL